MGSAVTQRGANKAGWCWEIWGLVKSPLEGQKIFKKEKLQERLLYVIYEISLWKSIEKRAICQKYEVINGLMWILESFKLMWTVVTNNSCQLHYLTFLTDAQTSILKTSIWELTFELSDSAVGM